MSKTAQSSMLIKSPAAAPDTEGAEGQEMTDKTAAELRELCRKTGETFDTSLTELQARQRIDALRDMD